MKKTNETISYFSNKPIKMADIRILHNRERAYLKDAISVYLERNESISSDWKKWLEKL